MFTIPKSLSFLVRSPVSASEKGMHAPSSFLMSLRFALCGLLGIVAGEALIMVGGWLGLAGSVILFFLSGVLAGLGLRAGISPALGVGVVFLCGDFSWSMFLMALQDMNLPSMPLMLVQSAAAYLLVYGVGSMLGLIPFSKFGSHVYIEGFLGFSVGGIYGGVLSTILFYATGGTSVSTYILFSFLEIMIPCAAGGLALGQAMHSQERRR